MKKIIWKHKLLIITLLAYGILFLVDAPRGMAALSQTGAFLKEMFQVLPPVMVISALIAVWVPREKIEAALGRQSGVRGSLLAMLIGSLSAGPIYAAFPAALVLSRKGASLANLVIIISSWAVIKVPLILVEATFLGVPFAALRYLLTVPAIFLMATLMERILGHRLPADAGSPALQEADLSEDPRLQEILAVLPGRDCRACGYASCRELAESVAAGKNSPSRCVFLDA